MTAVGICGHQVLGPAAHWVEGRLRAELDRLGPDVSGLSSLAAGADQIFARAVVERGSALTAVVPCRGYRHTVAGGDRAEYERLLAAAADVVTLDFPEPSEAAFLAAGRWVVDHCDLLLAVWDGAPARGPGGTADVVAYAHTRGREVRVCWPADGHRPA